MIATLLKAYWPMIVGLVVLFVIWLAYLWRVVDQAIATDPELTSAEDGMGNAECEKADSTVTTRLRCTVCGLHFGGKAAWCPECHAQAIEYRITASAGKTEAVRNYLNNEGEKTLSENF